jgi:hypothetical protein
MNVILTDIVKFDGMCCTCSNGKMYKLHYHCFFSTPVWANFTIENDEYLNIVLAKRVAGTPASL